MATSAHAPETETASGERCTRAPTAAAPATGAAGLAGLLRHGDAGARARALGRVQAAAGNRAAAVLARAVTYDDCTDTQASEIDAAHDRAFEMVGEVVTKLRNYDGTDPPEVRAALRRNFNTEERWIGRIIATQLDNVKMRAFVNLRYKCRAEGRGAAEAEALWCLPWSDIKVFPHWYARADGTPNPLDYRASTLIHEWMHRFACKLDVGYGWEAGYASHGTPRQFANADAYSTLVYEARTPAP